MVGVDTRVHSTLLVHIRQLWAYRELLKNFIRRDIKAQTKQSLLGYLWVFLPPLIQMGIFSLLFQGILKLQMTETVPYTLYVYCTTLPWQMFVNMVSQGTVSLVGHGTLLKQVYFPREIVVLAAMGAEGFKTLIASLVLVGLLAYFHVGVGIQLLWLPVLLGIQLLFSLGLVLPLALFNAFARDISKAVNIVLSLGMYLTPVVYPLEKVPESYRSLYLLNPMAILIHGYRRAILENAPLDRASLTFAVALALGAFCIAYVLFKRSEALLADII